MAKGRDAEVGDDESAIWAESGDAGMCQDDQSGLGPPIYSTVYRVLCRDEQRGGQGLLDCLDCHVLYFVLSSIAKYSVAGDKWYSVWRQLFVAYRPVATYTSRHPIGERLRV